uniref:Uncharacterized protein n=2 Tax=Trichobilharzia regenti TaxID=157069 RepID=A0AA85IQ02_TRIRE|nr:unnamed protein product [Trichobilharzia regenti]
MFQSNLGLLNIVTRDRIHYLHFLRFPMGKGQSSYDFEVQRRRIMKIYERDVIELEKAAKTCGSNIDHLRRTIQEWLKQLYVCTPSILLRIRKDQTSLESDENSKQNCISILRQGSIQHQIENKTELDRSKVDQLLNIDQKLINNIRRELSKMSVVEKSLNVKISKFLNEIQQFQQSMNCVLIDASSSEEIHQSRVITPKKWREFIRRHYALKEIDFSSPETPYDYK